MSIEKSVFGKMPDGTVADLYTLKNTSGMTAQISNYGCRIIKLLTADKHGEYANMLLGHDTFEEYLRPGDVHGAVIGRFANRIGGARFSINGKEYTLTANDGENSLHSAPGGFQNQFWRLKRSDNNDDAPSITFEYLSKDGECGFPGNLKATVTYTLSTDNALIIEYQAETDQETPINLTNHAYFNITGNPRKDILSNELQINADFITEVSDALIPTGKLLPVAGTPYDFNRSKTIGQDIRADDHLLKKCGGYDHNYVLKGEGMRKVGELYDQASGRVMMVFTDMPGMQVYTDNFDKPEKLNGGVSHTVHHAVCLETQFFPDSVHHPEFPYANLKPGEKFHRTTTYKFAVR
ncbi:MAG TPA: galactose mutarotase [Clostridiales bacterium]|jgi:aldose 1-epimerase|nr:galactose mutarotase [Clostridiales bacterium]